jgi:hypothetical protein
MKTSDGLPWVAMLFCLSVSLPLFAADSRLVELYDGSTISGRIVSLHNGIYTIESNSLGRLRLDAAKIRAIRAPEHSGGERGGMTGGMELETLQNRMVGNPTVMAQIMALQSDPQIRQLLADPEILRAVQSGDLDTLSQNPKFLELLQNSRIRAIQGEMLGH